MDHAALQAWIGREEVAHDLAAESPVRRLAALLDHDRPPWPTGEVPSLGHWLYFLPEALQSRIDVDGHPFRGGFLPPIDLPRRMWAGGRVTFASPIPLGALLQRRSSIADIKDKTGASGPLLFVTVRHEISADGVLSVIEEQDLVYRPAATPGQPSAPPAPSDARPFDFARTVVPDPVLLFRFSALTFNGHRIHYDRDYARDVEGYAGLVVHGPLQAVLLMDLFARSLPGIAPRAFSFRGQRPLIDTAPFDLRMAATLGGADLWTVGPDGQVGMTARVEAP
jgi:3-methylfumaryl-CoA hydratase